MELDTSNPAHPMNTQNSSTTTSYRPSAYYFRQALREETNIVRVRELGLTLVNELEQLKQWTRDQGLTPPRWNGTPAEFRAKGWVIPFSDGAL